MRRISPSPIPRLDSRSMRVCLDMVNATGFFFRWGGIVLVYMAYFDALFAWRLCQMSVLPYVLILIALMANRMVGR
jgi:hypothetical protein